MVSKTVTTPSTTPVLVAAEKNSGQLPSGDGCIITLLGKRNRIEELLYMFKELNHQWKVKSSIPQFVLLYALGEGLTLEEVENVAKMYNSITAKKSDFKIEMVDVTSQFDPKNAKSTPVGCVPEQFGIGYRQMCQFFAGEVFLLPALAKYRYFMRMDTDSRIHSPIEIDPLEDFKKNELIYGWALTHFDGRNCLINFQNHLNAFMLHGPGKDLKVMPSAYKNEFFGSSFREYKFGIYYNNFEITDNQYFRGPEYQGWFKSIKDQDNFIKYRWGDAPIRSVFVTLFVPAAKIKNYCDILDYTHQYDWSKVRCSKRKVQGDIAQLKL